MSKKDDGTFSFKAAAEDFPQKHKATILNIGIAETGTEHSRGVRLLEVTLCLFLVYLVFLWNHFGHPLFEAFVVHSCIKKRKNQLKTEQYVRQRPCLSLSNTWKQNFKQFPLCRKVHHERLH